jgi:predicted dehydrogenase
VKVGIIGCGKQADSHLGHLLRIRGCIVVGTCDTELLMAKQLAERYDVPAYFEQAEDLLDKTRPDVIHIITPPVSHFSLGKLSLEAGCHVMMEKPFTTSFEEAESLINLAASKGLRVTVGHHHQFSDAALRVRDLVGSGFLGEDLIHMESTFGYDFTDQRYARNLLGDRTHWVRGLPGGLLQNIISHAVSKVAEFITDDRPDVLARGFTSRSLDRMNEHDIIDELRAVIIHRHSRTTAYITFSSQISPLQHQLRLYGSSGSLIADYEHETVFTSSRTPYKSYLRQIAVPFVVGKQFLTHSANNLKRLLAGTLSYESGRRRLIESFYQSIEGEQPEPIPYREILLTSWIMDQILGQVPHRMQPEVPTSEVRT